MEAIEKGNATIPPPTMEFIIAMEALGTDSFVSLLTMNEVSVSRKGTADSLELFLLIVVINLLNFVNISNKSAL